MSRDRAEVVVVGAGVMGLATARALARAGRDVLLLEQFRIGHARGSSHGSSRIFRLAYEEEAWVQLALEALPLWRELEEEAGEPLLAQHGSLDTGREAGPIVRALEACGVPFELLEAEEVRRRFGVSLGLGAPALFQPDGGVTWAERTLLALLASARAHGARVIEEARALSLDVRDDRVVVETEVGPVAAGAAVVTAGAWARGLLASAEVELPVVSTRETVAYLELTSDRPTPSVIDWDTPDPEAWGLRRAGTQLYALDAGGRRLKIGLHEAGPVAGPDADGRPDQAAVRCAADWAARTFELARPEPLATETCFYTSTPDERFVLERHGRLVVGSPCSGHGFKFAPAIGARLAALAAEAL